MAAHQEAAYEHLCTCGFKGLGLLGSGVRVEGLASCCCCFPHCRWVQAECRGLGEHAPEVDLEAAAAKGRCYHHFPLALVDNS
jgi:hypothetical protein